MFKGTARFAEDTQVLTGFPDNARFNETQASLIFRELSSCCPSQVKARQVFEWLNLWQALFILLISCRDNECACGLTTVTRRMLSPWAACLEHQQGGCRRVAEDSCTKDGGWGSVSTEHLILVFPIKSLAVLSCLPGCLEHSVSCLVVEFNWTQLWCGLGEVSRGMMNSCNFSKRENSQWSTRPFSSLVSQSLRFLGVSCGWNLQA